LALENIPTPIGATRLATPATIEEFAMELYGALRSGDQKGIKRIVVISPEGDGIAVGIRDRLSKAAAG
jgi:L-threonylcarbamoyladenylate synthase